MHQCWKRKNIKTGNWNNVKQENRRLNARTHSQKGDSSIQDLLDLVGNAEMVERIPLIIAVFKWTLYHA